MSEAIEELDRQIRKLQSEIDSYTVDSQRRDKLGTAEEIYRAGWTAGWETSRETLEVDWEVYQLDKARTQEKER